MKSNNKKKHGGYREGAGRRAEVGKTKSRRIPEDITNDDIKLLTKYKRHNLPLYEMKVEDGVPSILSREQYENHKSADKLFINDIEDHFMVKVSGYHLKESGILENDILLVHQKKDLQHNNIVVATSNTGKAVLKKIIKELESKDIKVVIFATPKSSAYLNLLPKDDKIIFDQMLDELENSGITVYKKYDNYENYNIWSDPAHVAENKLGVIYSEDISKIIVKEITK